MGKSYRKTLSYLVLLGTILALPLTILTLIVGIPGAEQATVRILIVADIILVLATMLILYEFYRHVRNEILSSEGFRKFSETHDVLASKLGLLDKIHDESIKIEEALAEMGSNEDVELFRNICQFDDGPIAIVASTMSTEADSEYYQHFLYATGSGQFYALSYLLPRIIDAYRSRDLKMVLCEHIRENELDDFNVIILGGSPTNTYAEAFYKELSEAYNLPFGYKLERERKWHGVEIYDEQGQKKFKTDLNKGRGTDYGLIVRCERPMCLSRKVLFLIGGSTSGTEAAAKFICTDEKRRALRDRSNFACIITTDVDQHRSTKIRSIGALFDFQKT